MKKNSIYILIGLAVVFFLLFYIKDSNYKKPVDWTPSYSRYDKNPYGCFILYNEWKQIFSKKFLKPIDKSIYALLYSEEDNYYTDEYSNTITSPLKSTIQDWYYYDDYKDDQAFKTKIEDLKISNPDLFKNRSPSNFVFIAEMNSLSDDEAQILVNHIAKGNTVFMSAHNYSVSFPFIHNFKVKKRSEHGADSTYLLYKDGEKFTYKKNSVRHYLSFLPNENIEVLATNNDNAAVLIKVKYGYGHLIISSTPLAYTNVNMLVANNNKFISNTLNHLSNSNTWWCGNYLEYGFNFPEEIEDNRSIMQFIHSQPPLAWSFYILLISILIYFALATKRKQREIPEYHKPINTSVEFTNTISRLYLRQKDHLDISEKMITYFFEEIRNKYYLNPHQPKVDFIDKLSSKSGVEKEEVAKLFNYIKLFKEKTPITEVDITTLNRYIQEFKNKSH